MSQVTKTTAGGVTKQIRDSNTRASVAGDFDMSQSYDKGQFCYYNKKLYRAKVACVAGAFVSANWQECTVCKAVKESKDAFENVFSTSDDLTYILGS